MKELMHLKELYLDEIRKVNKKGEMTPADGENTKRALEGLEKIKDICGDLEEDEEEMGGYSEGRSMRHYSRGYSNGYSDGMRSVMPEMRDGRDYYGADGMNSMSYGGRGMGMGSSGYSRHSASTHAIEELEMLYDQEMDERKRRAIRNCIKELKEY